MTTIQGLPDPGEGLRLHLNENTGGCSPQVAAAVRAFDASALALYPDYKPAILETAAHLGIDPDWLMLTNGLDEGILLACIGYLAPRAPTALVDAGASPVAPSGQPEVIIVLPAFDSYAISAKAMRARVVALPHDSDYEFPLDAVLRRRITTLPVSTFWTRPASIRTWSSAGRSRRPTAWPECASVC
ncbi:MAG: hypothetical protein LC791_01595 [Acidobacteria bacterium]|nr:hypothetical protein [Acidobacteriota bacterium]